MTLLSSAAVLFFILDPFGNVPKVLVVLKNIEKRRREQILIRELLIALGIMVLFLFAGHTFLELMHVSQKSLSVGGGFLLLLIAIRMVFPPTAQGAEGDDAEEPFIVPLAVPYFAGPASLATIAVMGSGEPSERMVWLGAIVLAWFIASTIMFFGSRLAGLIGKRGLIATERLMGMILIAIAVEMLFTGIGEFIQGMELHVASS